MNMSFVTITLTRQPQAPQAPQAPQPHRHRVIDVLPGLAIAIRRPANFHPLYTVVENVL